MIPDLISSTIDVFVNRWPTIWNLVIEHMYLSLISIGIAILISVPLGIYLTRHQKMADSIIGITGVFQTIPSLALLVFLVPFIGTGQFPAIIALTIYGLLPILRNTYLGIVGVDRAAVEAGVGMGMTNRQVLWMVELPLALSVIMGGIRTATVLIIGVATIAGLIGAGGLGDLIFRGLQTYNTGLILAGAIPSALLAIVFDYLLKLLETDVTPRGVRKDKKSDKNSGRIRKWVVVALILILPISALVTQIGNGGGGKTITITGKNFTEQEIMVYVMGHLIEEKTDLNVEYESFLGGTAPAFEGVKTGEYDLYMEYTGTGLLNILQGDMINDPDKVYDIVKKKFKEEYDLVWLEPIGFNNTYTLTIREDDAKKWGVKTISDLKKKAPELTLGSEPEFLERKDGYPGLQETYGIEFRDKQTMDSGIMYSAIKNGEVDVIDAFATDGRIPAFNLRVLEDDKNSFPPYYAVPVIRADTLEKYPELEKVLGLLAGKIDNEKMQELNSRVDIDKEQYEDVAVDFLKEEGLIEK
ncbi:glycine betaine ABC transporter substrate-binding protein [Paenactinomyces guangxiensis]|uniref:ABC transporter permease subunit n=1 Tax=Paenactinomyces guangxiensis TaxID=1490290 RepID=A0A7W1WQ45_9BACL|nr:glycine betaine ABC transporter substrate-binding protein [Paenactinomyces guangxiensis]MBA4493826.1 ABC transporter permease subunit [Paenactinomyces guangxiensis]MBH8591292.1 ABC transporter permease subunit [Paenactinomyces guangxiensis]